MGTAEVDDGDTDLVWWATWLGLLACGAGFIDGLVLALRRRLSDCPDGTYFPRGETDFSCFVHPQAGFGIAITALSVALAGVVIMASIGARAALSGGIRA